MSDPRPMNDGGQREPPPNLADPTQLAEATRLAETRSTPSLIGDLIGHVTELFRKEVMLLRAEVRETSNKVTTAGILLGVAAVLALVGLIYLAGAATLGLVAAGLDPAWATLIVGAVLAIVGGICALVARSRLRAASLAPQRTVESLSRDASLAKEKVK